MNPPKSSHRSIKYFFIFLPLGIFLFPAALGAWAASDPTSCVITIKSVQLENDKGQWLTVIEPDHEVDIVKDEPGLSFFNRGRVPEGRYVNFKVIILSNIKVTDTAGHYCNAVREDGSVPDAIEICGTKDFEKPLSINKASFVGVWFSVDTTGTIEGRLFKVPRRVSALTITVDQDTRSLPSEAVQIHL